MQLMCSKILMLGWIEPWREQNLIQERLTTASSTFIDICQSRLLRSDQSIEAIGLVLAVEFRFLCTTIDHLCGRIAEHKNMELQ